MKRLPLTIYGEIFLRSLERDALQTTSRILGARPGDFILIEEPIARAAGQSTVSLRGELLCAYFHEGEIYRFKSQTKASAGRGLTFIHYPVEFEVEPVRQYPRVALGIEAALHLEGDPTPLRAAMLDISEGGCCIRLPDSCSVDVGTLCSLDFILPDHQYIDGLHTKVCALRSEAPAGCREFGLRYLGPEYTIARIGAFCRTRLLMQSADQPSNG